MTVVSPPPDTPVVRIDLDAVDRNIRRMQDNARAQGLDLRAHVKTHKLPRIARSQLDAGAVGLACQKASEAEVMVDSGLGPILITFPIIGEAKVARVARLAERADITVTVDSLAGLEGLSQGLGADRRVSVLVDCDTGRWRTGVPDPEAALALARAARELPNLAFRGLFTHPAPPAAGAFFAEARRLLADAGIPVDVVSVGGTLTAYGDEPRAAGATELRVGTYVYGDRACLAAGVVSQADCAMRVAATVVSTPSPDRAIIDAGSKTLTSDSAEGVDDGLFGLVVDEPQARVVMLSEEHGHLDLSACPGALSVGQIVELIPNHACGVTNLHDEVALHRSGEPEGMAEVAARGTVR